MLVVNKNYYDPLLLSLRIGDGCYVKNSRGERFGSITYYVQVMSYNEEYITFKRNYLLNLGIFCRECKIIKSGYSNTTGKAFETRIHPLISEIGNMSKLEVIKALNLSALIIYYLDDGSFHQKKKFGHIYCSSFLPEEIDALISRFERFYPKCKLPILRYDRKNNGREFPYLYIPVSTMKEFSKDIRDFIIRNSLYSMLYKVGEHLNEVS